MKKDTTGVLIITNDGNYTHKATHPKNCTPKEYQVTLKKSFQESYIKTIENGMKINHGETQLKSGSVVQLNQKSCLLTIHEEKFHQIKKIYGTR